jgi:hypothetical protein
LRLLVAPFGVLSFEGEVMKCAYRTAQGSLVLSAFIFASAAWPAFAETPGEIPKPWTYEGSMKLQEQQRQQDQQFQQQPQSQQSGGAMAQGGAQSAAWDAARRNWQKKPPLPADRNPLLGKWTRPPSTRGDPNDPFAQLKALAKGGMCEVLFGSGGVFEFRPDRLVGMDARTPEEELDRVEYRGDAKHVAVLPKTTLKLIEFDFDGPNRIHWTGQNCVLVRVGATSTDAAAAAPPKVANAAPTATAASRPSSGGALLLSVGATSPTDKVAGRKLWVLKADPQVALIKGGLTSTPNGTVLQNWMRACQKRDQACATGAQALQVYSVGLATTDANGRAQTPPLPPGRYWVLSDAKVDNMRLMWNQPVDVKGVDTSVTLDKRNAMPVE